MKNSALIISFVMSVTGCVTNPTLKSKVILSESVDKLDSTIFIDSRKTNQKITGSAGPEAYSGYRYGDDSFSPVPLVILSNRLKNNEIIYKGNRSINIRRFELLNIQPTRESLIFAPPIITYAELPWGSAYFRCLVAAEVGGNSVRINEEIHSTKKTFEKALKDIALQCVSLAQVEIESFFK